MRKFIDIVESLQSTHTEENRHYPLAPRGEWYGDGNYADNGGKIVMMSPDEYLSRARPLEIDDASRENIDDLKQHIESGRTLDPLVIYPDGKEDGRHRAHAAKELGIREIPVIVFEDTSTIMEEGSSELWRGKNVVATIGEYRIAVDDPHDANFVSVWTEDNKRVGALSTRRTPDLVGREYLGISRAEIDPKHRGKRLGIAMYRALIDHLGPNWKGISSYLPDQANKKQVPKIWKRLNGVRKDDHIVVNRG